jgi:hypothetical protein
MALGDSNYQRVVESLRHGNVDHDEPGDREQLESLRRDLQSSAGSLAAIRKIVGEFEETIQLQRQLLDLKQRRIGRQLDQCEQPQAETAMTCCPTCGLAMK